MRVGRAVETDGLCVRPGFCGGRDDSGSGVETFRLLRSSLCHREVVVGGRGGDLVGDDTYGLAGRELAVEEVEEVFARGIDAVDDGGAEDKGVGAGAEDELFAAKLGEAVAGDGVGRAGLGVGAGEG